MKKLNQILALVLAMVWLATTPNFAHASENLLTPEQAAAQGYTPYKWMAAKAAESLNPLGRYTPNALKWPFEKPYSKSHIGNNFVQFQPYDQPGYHQGSDMLLENDSWAVSPVNGRLEAGHYGYTDLPNGDRIKLWKPWPQPGSETYFEIAVIDDKGYRYEFHHIERSSLPAKIVNALNSGKGTVKAGERIGQVYTWSTAEHYTHVHLNVYSPFGVVMNPEAFFKIIPDYVPPKVRFLVIYQDNSTEWLLEGAKLKKPVKSFVVSGADEKNLNQYVQAIPLVQLLQNGKVIAQNDFRETLLDGLGVFRDIREIYPVFIKLSNGQFLEQPDDYYPVQGTQFHQQLSVDNAHIQVSQKFQLRAQDMAGNMAVLNGIF